VTVHWEDIAFDAIVTEVFRTACSWSTCTYSVKAYIMCFSIDAAAAWCGPILGQEFKPVLIFDIFLTFALVWIYNNNEDFY